MFVPSRFQKIAATVAVSAGVAVGAAGISSAATSPSSGSTTTATTTTAAVPAKAPSNVDPATLSHGPGETLVTGANLTTLTKAALTAVPGSTVIRAETDSGGAAYEVHLTKADGSDVTVKFDSSFNVTATQDGFGSGPAGP